MKRYSFFILLLWCFTLVPETMQAQGPTVITQELCWATPATPSVDSSIIGYYIYTGRSDTPLLVNYLDAAGDAVDVSAGGTIRVGACDPDFSALGSATNELFVYRLDQGEDYSLPLDTLDKYERFFFYGSGNDELNDTATISLPTFPDQNSNRYIGKRLFFHLQELTADSTSAVIITAPGDPSGSRLRQYNCYNDAVTSQNDTFTVTTEGIERLIEYTTVPRKATGDYFRECTGGSGGGAGVSDGVATAGALDVPNQEIDITVASPGSNFSIPLALLPTLSGFSGWDQDASDDFDGAFSSLTGVPSGLDDGDNQALSLSSNTLSLTNGGSVDLSTYLDNTDTQDLSLSGTTLSLTDGGSVDLSSIQDGTGTDDQTAAEVSYDNTSSGLATSTVQGAIDLLENEIDAVSSGASDGVATAGALDVPNQEIDITVASPGSNFSIPLALLPTLSGFSGWDQDASDDFDGAFSSLTGVPEGLNDGDNQALSLSSNTLSLTNGGSVDLSGYLSNIYNANGTINTNRTVTVGTDQILNITTQNGDGQIYIQDGIGLQLGGNTSTPGGRETVNFPNVGGGLQYGANYSNRAGFGNRTIPDWGYVRSHTVDTLSTLADTTAAANNIGRIVHVVSEDAKWTVNSAGEWEVLITGTDDQTALEVPYTDNNSFGHTDLQGAVDSLVQEVQTLRDEQVIKPSSTSGTITANLANKRGRIFQVNLTPAPSPSTLVVNNPREAGVYTFQFIGVTNNDVAFPANFYNADETSLGTVTFTASDFITCLYDGADFYCK